MECSNLSLCLAQSIVIIVCYYSSTVSGVIFIFFQEADEPGHQSCLGTSLACYTDHQHLLMSQYPTAEDFHKLILFANLCFLSDFSKEQLSSLPFFEGLISSLWQTKQLAIFMTQMPDKFSSCAWLRGNISAKHQEELLLDSLVILPFQAGLPWCPRFCLFYLILSLPMKPQILATLHQAFIVKRGVK